MSACLIFCAAAPAPAATWALTPLTVGLALNAVGLILAALGTYRARADSRQARERQEAAEGRERVATNQALMQSRREQAAKVAAWTVVKPVPQGQFGLQADQHRSHVRMANRSDLPVTQISVIVNVSGAMNGPLPDAPGSTHLVFRDVLGPGEVLDVPMDYVFQGPEDSDVRAQSTTFTDAEGQEWVRDTNGLHHVGEDDG